MGRTEAKAKRVEVRLPWDLYEQIEAIARQHHAPIHHRSGRPQLTPTILALIQMGLGQADPDAQLESSEAQAHRQAHGQMTSKLQELEARLQQLEARSQATEQSLSAYAIVLQRESASMQAQIQPIEPIEVLEAELEWNGSFATASEPEDPLPPASDEGLNQLELCHRFGISHQTLVRDSRRSGFASVQDYLEARTGYQARQSGRWWRYYQTHS